VATPKRPPRSWDIDSLFVLGKKQGAKSDYLKAVPVLILEKWIREGREVGAANCIYTSQLAKRLERSDLVTFKSSKGTSIVLASLTRIQGARNLTRPPLIEYHKGQEFFAVNLPRYETLLEEYRQKYRALYSKDYAKLFPSGEPNWEVQGSPDVREELVEELRLQDDIEKYLAQIRQVFHDKQEAISGLTHENQKLKDDLQGAKAGTSPSIAFVHTSPDFHRSGYHGKVTSIKNTIGDMLDRAEDKVRISTRQMDMFTDDLIALKRRRPNIEIIVLSRGPQGAEGDRKRLAGVAFDRMKQAGIKLPVERETLHSRLMVIDAKEALVSSADLDFTHMELEFNAGIWTNNAEVVAEAIRYFDNLLGLSQGN